MPNGTEDLWPADVQTPTVVPPVAILRRQAAILADRTKGLLEGQVDALTEGEQFRLLFYIVAPSLGYRYKLFEVWHGVEGYPVYATDDGRRPLLPTFGRGPAPLKLNTPDELIAWLRQTLNSEETKRVVGSLLSQVTA